MIFCKKINKIRFFYLSQIFDLNQIFFDLKKCIFAPRFYKVLKLVCLLNDINNMAAMLLLFPVMSC